jgi:hypothetical protein
MMSHKYSLKNSPKISRKILITIAAALSLSSCETVRTAPQRGSDKIDTGSMLPVPSGRGSREDSGLVLAYEFVTPNGEKIDDDGMCRLRLVEMSTRKSYFMQIDRSKSASYVGLPSGHYETVRIGCGIMKTWDVGDIFKGGLQVQTGGASYAGKVSFVFKKGQLEVVERASRQQHANGFQAATAAVPQGLGIVSAYNLMPLTEEMASEGANASGFDLQAQGIPTGPVLNKLLSQLHHCDSEGAKDPLRFGKLDYTASYKNGKFSDFTSRKDPNAFGDQFKSCVTETLSSFRPPQTGAVEIHVIY